MLESLKPRTCALATLLCVPLLAAACSTVDVDTKWDREAHFDALHTWSWAPTRSSARAEPGLPGGELHRRVQTAIERGLHDREYREVSADARPDFYVAYHVAVREPLDARTMYRDYQGGPYFGRWDLPEKSVEQYPLGTLIIDVIDTARDELIWRGVGESRLVDRRGALREKVVDEAVRRLLERFPPRMRS